jgi:hypothetical protein
VAASLVIPVIYHEIATHPMGARDDRVSARRSAIVGLKPSLTLFDVLIYASLLWLEGIIESKMCPRHPQPKTKFFPSSTFSGVFCASHSFKDTSPISQAVLDIFLSFDFRFSSTIDGKVESKTPTRPAHPITNFFFLR